MKIKEKKGSHVGVVISFVIFMTSIIFIYIVVQPSIKLGGEQNFLESLELSLTERTSSNLTSVSVGISGTVTSGCVKLNDFFVKTNVGNNFIVIDGDENVISAKIAAGGNDLFVLRNDESFLKILESPEFDIAETGDETGCQNLNEGSGYNLGLVKTEQRIFETKIIKLINDYNTDYKNLKTELNVSDADEFGVGFTYSNGTKINTQESNVSLSVYVSAVPIQYINVNAGIEPGILNIKAW